MTVRHFHAELRRSKVGNRELIISSTECRERIPLSSNKGLGDFFPSQNISILLFYTQERFPLQKSTKPEEKISCMP
jgi:hypothetical protein